MTSAKTIARTDVTSLSVPTEVTVSESIDAATEVLDGVGGLLSAGHWGTSAIVWAFTEDQQGSNQHRPKVADALGIREFAALKIRGLSSHRSVCKYRQAWQHAIDEGWAEPSEPGKRCVLPEQPFGGPGTAALIVASGGNEWYTPAKYIDAARSVMGSIDLDPASNYLANETVKANTIYTKVDDGLTQPWAGRIWLNPPYGGLAGDFISKLVSDFESKTVTSAITLVNSNCTDTEWFQPLWNYTLCFTNHRINFDSNGRDKSSSTHGSVFVYFGLEKRWFSKCFSEFGPIVRTIQRNPAIATTNGVRGRK